MKSILIVSIFVFLSTFSTEIKAQSCCPDSTYSQYSVFTTEPNSGCTMEIVFCYKQLPTGTRNVSLCQINFTVIGCNPSLIVFNPSFWSNVEQEMLAKMDILYPFQPCPPGGGQTNLVAEFKKPTCMKIIDDPVQQMSMLVPCGSGFGQCVAYYHVCKDQGVFHKTLVGGPYQIGIVDCPFEGYASISTIGCFPTCY